MERDVKEIVREIVLRPIAKRSRPIELPDFTHKRIAVSDEVLKDVAQLAASGKLEEIFRASSKKLVHQGLNSHS